MVMTALRDGASRGILKYFLLGLLVMAAGGLVFMDIGGFFRGGTSSGDVAKVGDQDISISHFDRTVRQSLNRVGMTPSQAYKLGFTTELLNEEIRTILLQLEAAKNHVRISNKEVAANIKKLIAPMSQPGQAPSEVLQQILISQGITEQGLINSIRREMTVSLLNNSISTSAQKASIAMAEDLARYDAETRNIRYIAFKDSDSKDIKTPDDQTLQAFYEKVKEAYASPEMRKSSVILIETKALKESLEISDEEIKDIYERNISSYSENEKRTVEQVIVTDLEEAEKIAKQAATSKNLKDAAQSVTGSTTDIIPSQALEKTDLLEELQDEVFAAQSGDIIGPIETGLGYQLVEIQKITPARVIPLSEAKKDLKEELTETRLLDAQYELANSVDDYLASGETLETLKEELGVKIESYALSNNFGLGEDGKELFSKEFGPDAQTLIKALFELAEGEASPVSELADGRMASIYVEKIQEKSYIPYNDIKEELTKKWIADNKRVQNKVSVLKLLSDARNSQKDIASLAKDQGKTIKTLKSLKRQGEPIAPLSPAAIADIFDLAQKELFIIDIQGGAAIGVVEKINIPEKPSKKSITEAQKRAQEAIQSENYILYMTMLQNKYGVSVNENLLESLYAPAEEF